ncbi:MAG: MFS transporter [Lentisphaeria bacterium]|nr:MFS transporter [Lentisphaeria bacterium]
MFKYSIIPDDRIDRKKFFILCLGILLSFFTSMSKMLVPGPVYNQLHSELAFDPAAIAALGALYMYTYAASQLLAGVFADRYGGVRVLLIGGSLFTLGFAVFPLSSNYYILACARSVCGFGAGMVFLGNSKIVNDLFPGKFAAAMGLMLFVGYLGPVVGTIPMVALIEAVSWRVAFGIPGGICVAIMLLVALILKGTIKKVIPGQTLQPLFTMCRNRAMWKLCVSTAIGFGVYYLLLTQIGQKCFEDFYSWSKYSASLVVTFLTITVALNNVVGNFYLKFTSGRTKPIVVIGLLCGSAGSILGAAVFHWHLSGFLLILAFFLISIPAGFFPLYSLAAKELNPPEVTGLSVAILNFMAFVFIAFFGNVSGWILKGFQAKMKGGCFPAEAYMVLFIFMAAASLTALLLAVFLPKVNTFFPGNGKKL